MKRTHDKQSKQRGFTLIELLVVLVILGLLGGIVAPQIIGHIGKAKTQTAKEQIANIGAALDIYRLEVGRYPNNQEGLEALVAEPSGVKNWNGPYLKKKSVPQDPWGYDYHYKYPGDNGSYDLYSLGADNTEGGDDENQDVASWE